MTGQATLRASDSLGPYQVFQAADGQRSLRFEGREITRDSALWFDLLGSADAAALAALVAVGTGRGAWSVVGPGDHEVQELSAAEQALVKDPALTTDGEARVLTAFYTAPPSFDVWQQQIRATPSGTEWRSVNVLELLSPEDLLQANLQAIATADPMARRVYLAELGKTGDPRAVPAIVPSLDASTPEERRLAAKALGSIGSDDALAAVLARLDVEEDRQTIGTLVEAVKGMKNPGARPALESLAKTHANKVVRDFALVATLTSP